MQRSLDTLFWNIGKGMVAGVDYYAVLEIAETADDEEIKQAYRRLAKKYHPDLNPGNAAAEEKFKNVAEAYAVLGNAQRKREYDEKRTDRRQAYGGQPRQTSRQKKPSPARASGNVDFENLNKSVSDMFENFMGFK